MIRKLWQALRHRCAACAMTTLVAGGVLAGLVIAGLLLAGGAYGLAWTNTEQFCISCHEMRDNVYAEYQGTIHDQNRTGVRAVCSDCHVPRAPGPMLARKFRATFELYGHMTAYRADSPFDAWFTRILVNACLDRAKARTRARRWFLAPSDDNGAPSPIDTAVAKTAETDTFVWPRQRRPELALFQVRFVPGAAPDCRRYVVTITKDRWSTTALPMERCGAKLAARKSAP